MNFEPIGPSPVSGTRFGHPNDETLSESTGFAGGSVSLVDDAVVIVFALLNSSGIVASSAEETLAALASEGSEMKSCRGFIADSAKLILQRV